jgi:hypothetical protein
MKLTPQMVHTLPVRGGIALDIAVSFGGTWHADGGYLLASILCPPEQTAGKMCRLGNLEIRYH